MSPQSYRDPLEKIQSRDHSATLQPRNRWLRRTHTLCKRDLTHPCRLPGLPQFLRHRQLVECHGEGGRALPLLGNEVVEGLPHHLSLPGLHVASSSLRTTSIPRRATLTSFLGAFWLCFLYACSTIISGPRI